MLEARVHEQLKRLLRQDGRPLWAHHLSLSRLVARSLRRHDVTLISIVPGSEPGWRLSALLPCCLAGEAVALVVSRQLHQRFQLVELPRLHRAGIATPLWEGENCPQDIPLWLLKPAELVRAYQAGQLHKRQLVVLDSGQLEKELQAAMGVTLEPRDWNRLQQAYPPLAQAVASCFDRLNQQVFAHPANPLGRVPISAAAEAPLRQLLGDHGPMPDPWRRWLHARGPWVSWAEVDYRLLRWRWRRQPLDPLRLLQPLLAARGMILCGSPGPGKTLEASLGNRPMVRVKLGDPPLQDPLPLYAPRRQPLPNALVFPRHLSDQCCRLILARSGLTAVLLDDVPLRQALTSALAAEFGSRVVHECRTPGEHGVLCASWGWWQEHHHQLPLPRQLVIGSLPLLSLEDPITAARVRHWRQQGRDWFRELLLPDALATLQHVVACLRGQWDTRLAILDGRIHCRSWGQLVLDELQPWVSVSRLLPDETGA
ncbi:MAG: helicase [Cyanobacteria bacterium MAG CAR1_bin_15]|nr:helicase [Cyanobacteria bacterium MAG CAR1_bin_15]